MTQRDLDRLAGVHPTMIQKLEPILDQLGMFVIVGVRTTDQEHDEWLKGRLPDGTVTDPHAIVTNCDGYKLKSNHQVKDDGYGHAVDCGFDGPHPYAGDFHAFGLALEAAGLKWGGRFRSPIDLDHAEMP
jgi:hypothetical protein